ncbi:chorismate-binding protein [Flagellimonas myxillae]|uniref:chorismate-binding protein n=1 Tax=Flagellimonas myxillae TaxID=2942214 RepID=UPI00201E7A77|nr:chorismate-binding protein [Muricauda myxillae]MCL6266139.1 chorismate-binding protein [Muricauda myxillae]
MPYPENKDFQELLEQMGGVWKNDRPFAIYRKPGERTIIAILQDDNELHIAQNFDEQGFVFAPFDWKDDAVIIQADQVLTTSWNSTTSQLSEDVEVMDQGKKEHLELVQKGVSQIEKGSLRKVVLSRKVELEYEESPLEIFQKLLENYANAFCYLFHHPEIGSWCGATPETLVHIRGGEFRTMSLAATLAYVENQLPDWGNKEIEEQKMVSNYILDQLGDIAHPLQMDPVESVRAGNLWHLKSEIRGRLLSNTSIADVLRALHPTPAVCGIPTHEAKNFILAQEGYQRKYYTGFLGELNLAANRSASLFVNLRCMEIHQGKASLFVGGGITRASDPEKEWTETQNKSKTLLNILQFAKH